jgi:hypothetical protein
MVLRVSYFVAGPVVEATAKAMAYGDEQGKTQAGEQRFRN